MWPDSNSMKHGTTKIVGWVMLNVVLNLYCVGEVEARHRTGNVWEWVSTPPARLYWVKGVGELGYLSRYTKVECYQPLASESAFLYDYCVINSIYSVAIPSLHATDTYSRCVYTGSSTASVNPIDPNGWFNWTLIDRAYILPRADFSASVRHSPPIARVHQTITPMIAAIGSPRWIHC